MTKAMERQLIAAAENGDSLKLKEALKDIPKTYIDRSVEENDTQGKATYTYWIPKLGEPEDYEQTAFLDSAFIELRNDEKIEVSMQYPFLKMKNAESHCFVRIEMYNHLKKAAELLPDGYKFKILDAWRPFALQKELYEVYTDKIVKMFHLENCSQQERDRVIKKFVSLPVEDRLVPPVHTTGGAIDLTLIDQYGKELEMGTGFDEFTNRTYVDYYEESDETKIRDNRRMLYHIMTSSGFTNLSSEWWHYDYGDRFWAYYTKRPAIYSGVFTIDEMQRQVCYKK